MPIVFCMKIEDQKFFKSDTFESDTIFVTFKSVTFEIFGKCLESVNFDVNNDLQEDVKIFKSDTFENHKSFVPVEVQSLHFVVNSSLRFMSFSFQIHEKYDK